MLYLKSLRCGTGGWLINLIGCTSVLHASSFGYLLTCDDIHPARAESASMALTASRTAADQARRSWARSIASDAHALFHLRMPNTAGPMSRTRSSFSVAAQVFSCPPGRLRHVRGTSGLISSRMISPGARRAA